MLCSLGISVLINMTLVQRCGRKGGAREREKGSEVFDSL